MRKIYQSFRLMIKIPLGNKLIYIFTAARTGVCEWYGRYPPALWYDFVV